MVYYDGTSKELGLDAGKDHYNETYQLTISDITGQIIKLETIAGHSKVRINVQSLLKGIHIVSITGSETISKKIIIY